MIINYDFNQLKPSICQAVFKATGRVLTINGKISPKISFNPGFIVEDIIFENANWSHNPNMAKIERFEIQVYFFPLLYGNINIKKIVLISPEILIETNEAKSNLDFLKTKTPKKENNKSFSFPFQNLIIKNGILKIKNNTIPDKEYKIILQKVTAFFSDSKKFSKIKIIGDYENIPFKADTSFDSLLNLNNPNHLSKFHISVQIAAIKCILQGTIKDIKKQSGLNLDFIINAKDLNIIQKIYNISITDFGQLIISGNIHDISSKYYQISDLTIKNKKSLIEGSINIDLNTEKPRILSILNSKYFDISPFIPDKNNRKKIEKENTKKNNFSKFVNSLQIADIALRLRLKKLAAYNLIVNDLSTDILVESGQFRIKPLKANIGYGNIDAQIYMYNKDSILNPVFILKAENIEVGKLLPDQKISSIVEGSFNLNIDLKSFGKTQSELLSEIDGNINFEMSKFKINNSFIKLLNSDLSNSLFRLVNPYRYMDNHTNIKCFVAMFKANKGICQSNVLVLDTKYMSVIGEGSLNFANQAIDISLMPVPKQGIDIKGIGKLNLSLGELTKPFKLSGTINDPHLAIDPTQTAITIGKALGGAMLFGPIGIAAALISNSSDDDNPCIAAIEAAKKGVKYSGDETNIIDKASEKVNKGIHNTIEGFKKLFND